MHLIDRTTGTTRERIIRMLLAGPMTIEALAERLGITKNAVRSHIALLESEGAAHRQGSVKGARRPFALYGLTEGADVRLSRAYPSVASNLIRVLSEELSDSAFGRVMEKLGVSIASSGPRASGDASKRARAAVDFLATLGSAADLSERDGSFVVSSDGCPIGAAVEADERSCSAMESMLSEFTGMDVATECRHDPRHRCRFVLSAREIGV